MNSLLNNYRRNAANKLYKDSKHNLTQKELILKSYSRSADFISYAIEHHKNNEYNEYNNYINNSIKIIQNMLFNLNYYDANGNKLIVADNLHSMYTYILTTLKNGLRNKNTKDFEVCISHLHELYDAFEKAN